MHRVGCRHCHCRPWPVMRQTAPMQFLVLFFSIHFACSNVKSVLEEVRQNLKKRLRLNIDNENINCTAGHPKCAEYTLVDSFHFFVIEEPHASSAAVYTINPKLNKQKGSIEAAILDALSRHSMHNLMKYASRKAEKEIGYIRKLSTEELLKLRRKKPHRRTVMFSPIELDLLDQSILEYRSFSKPENYRNLEQLNSKSVMGYIKGQSISFVQFWSNVNSVSQHSFYLWSKASEILKKRFPKVLFGAVPCHKEFELCDNLDITVLDKRTIIAYQNGRRYSSTKDMGNVRYYVDWVSLILNGPLIRLENEDEWKYVKKGRLKGFEESGLTMTIGIFGSENCSEFLNYDELARILKGRYYLTYFIKQGSRPSLSTVRPNEKQKRVDFKGSFNVEEMAHFIAKSSLPTVLDISEGFTPGLLPQKEGQQLMILLISSKHENFSVYSDWCSRNPPHFCTLIIRERCGALEELSKHFRIGNEGNQLVMINKEKIYVQDMVSPLDEKSFQDRLQDLKKSQPIDHIAENSVHPLQYLQLAKINQIFGFQETLLLPEPKLTRSHLKDPISSQGYEEGGGCPFMRQQQQRQTDEL